MLQGGVQSLSLGGAEVTEAAGLEAQCEPQGLTEGLEAATLGLWWEGKSATLA